ncbi:MAG: four helix bundle protein [Gemmataceae bacterium]
MQDFHNLKVWQKAHALTLAVYQATTAFPPDERFGLPVAAHGILDSC